jgi:hypothetical protein
MALFNSTQWATPETKDNTTKTDWFQNRESRLQAYPMIDTYVKKGMQKDNIIDDALYTTAQYIANYTDSELEYRNIPKDFFNKNNLRRLYEDGQIKFLFNAKGGTKNPVYDIYLDANGDGEWQRLTNSKDRDSFFRPENTAIKYTSTKYKNIKSKVLTNMSNKFLNEYITRMDKTIKGTDEMDFLASGMDNFLREYNLDPNENPQIPSMLTGMMNVIFDVTFNQGQEGLVNLQQMFNAIPFLPNVNFDWNAIRDIQQNEILNQIALEQAREKLGDEIPNILKGEISVKFDESQISLLMTNPYGESIIKHEGFSDTVIDAKSAQFNSLGIGMDIASGRVFGGNREERQPYIEGSAISKAQYEILQDPKSDPTIGPGLSLKDKVNVEILESIKDENGNQKYTLEGLMNGTQRLDRVDAFYVFYKRLAEKLTIANNKTANKMKTKPYDLRLDKNILLAAGIVNLEYLGGGYNGDRFYSALDNFNRTGDAKWIGKFEPYKEGDEPTIGQELYTDALNAKINQNLGGYMNRFNDVYDLIKAWSLGSFDFNPAYVLNPEIILNG